jgi:hypothetical protein
VREVVVVDEPHEHADPEDHAREQLAKLVQAALQRGVHRRLVVVVAEGRFRRLGRGALAALLPLLLLLLLLALHATTPTPTTPATLLHRRDLRLDLANLSGHPGRDHHPGPGTIAHGRARKQHALFCLQLRRLFSPRQRLGGLDHRHRLPCEGRLLRAQSRGLERDQAQVGGHAVASGQLDDVAGHELSCRQVGDEFSPTQNARRVALQALEGVQGSLGVRLLPDAHGGVEREDEQDDGRLEEGAQALLGRVLARAGAAVKVGEQEGDGGGGEEDLFLVVVVVEGLGCVLLFGGGGRLGVWVGWVMRRRGRRRGQARLAAAQRRAAAPRLSFLIRLTHLDERVVELLEDQLPERRARLLGQLVAAEAIEARARLLLAQADAHVDVELARHLLRRAAPPRRARLLLGGGGGRARRRGAARGHCGGCGCGRARFFLRGLLVVVRGKGASASASFTARVPLSLSLSVSLSLSLCACWRGAIAVETTQGCVSLREESAGKEEELGGGGREEEEEGEGTKPCCLGGAAAGTGKEAKRQIHTSSSFIISFYILALPLVT